MKVNGQYDELIAHLRSMALHYQKEWEAATVKAKAAEPMSAIAEVYESDRRAFDYAMHALYSAIEFAGEGDWCPCLYCVDQRAKVAR